MSRGRAEIWRARVLRHGPWLLVMLVGLSLLWPVPLGQMPLSADHTVHLTRIWLFAEQLAQGQVRGWSDVWFLGTPVGELYPVLGDLLVVAVRVLSLGLLDWHQSYAVGFTIAFIAPGWAILRAGRALGLGALPGLVAAGLTLCDVGAYREGGWIYTVTYGVWPQHLSTGLTWWGMAELALACTHEESGGVRRHLGLAALALGGAILAHPMALPSIAIGGPVLVLALGLRPWRRLPRVAAIALLGGVLSVLVAAWWLVPMLAHRGWMASYGWTWMPLSKLAHEAAAGRWAQHMPTAVGATTALGLVLLAIRGNAAGRFFGALALLLWLLASEDALWSLRLDQLSAGFAHVQYQRFIVAAKPGLFLAAGAGLGLLVAGAGHVVRSRWPSPGSARPLAAALGAIAIGMGAWMAVGQRSAMRQHEVGEVQLTRMPRTSSLDEDYPELVRWLSQRWSERGDAFWRTTVVASRNLHWFMDAPVGSGVPLYKQGFTPGDNFVHKPESGKSAVLDRARVRYVVAPRGRGGRGQEVASFGDLRVLERAGWDALPLAWIQGAAGDGAGAGAGAGAEDGAAVEVLEAQPDGGPIRVRVTGTSGPTTLVFAISGYPRWELVQDGRVLDTFEVPLFGDAASVSLQARRSGELRGGKALGDDGSEPTLLAAIVEGDGELQLRYRARTPRDVLAGLVSWIAIAIATGLVLGGRRLAPLHRAMDAAIVQLSRITRPAVLGIAVVAALGLAGARWRSGAAQEAGRAVGQVYSGRARAQGAHAGLIKTDMLIRPAVLVHRRRTRAAVVELPDVVLGDTLTGWLAIDDDAAQLPRRGTHRVRIVARTGAGEQVVMPARVVAHRPGLVPLKLDTRAWSGQRATLQVIVDSDGEAPPPLGFDLQLPEGS